VLALLLVATPAAAVTLTRGPYLQLLTTESVTVVWRTDVPAACSLTVRPPVGDPSVIIGSTGTDCAVTVGDLSAGTEYGYTPHADGIALDDESTFRTDDPDRPFAFIAIGDSGSGNADQRRVRDVMLDLPADLVIHTGDMIYNNGEAANFDPRFFAPYRDLVRRMVFWPCLGNHDVVTATGQPWRDAFQTPANNASGTENYYSFDYGNAHFVVLDSTQSTDPGGLQHEFLVQDLAASRAWWKIVAFHHTIYSSGDHGSDLDHQQNLAPVFDRFSVDLVLMGHDHVYERSFPLRAGEVVGPGEGTVYITTGGGGEGVGPLGSASFTAYGELAFHVTYVRVDGPTLTAEMVRDDGLVRDSVTLAKSAPSPPCRNDADCADGARCTADTCTPDGCRHEVMPPEAVLAKIEASRALTECQGAVLPRFVTRRLDRAGGAVARALVAQRPKRSERAMTAAVRRLAAIRDRLGSAGLPANCAGGIDALLAEAEGDGECLASRRCTVADTFIDSGREADENHGGVVDLRVDRSPHRVTYLKFDLTAVRGRIRKAILDLYPTGRSADGGALFQVPSSSWLEGEGNEVEPITRRGPGLTWEDVDVNDDNEIDAADTSPLVPGALIATLGRIETDRVEHLDVTRAVSHGPDVYTLAIVSRSEDGVTFASREHPIRGQRPMLRILR
jgi:hypothetical protein